MILNDNRSNHSTEYNQEAQCFSFLIPVSYHKKKGVFFSVFGGGGGVWGGVEEEGEDAASLVVCLCDHSDTFVVSLYSIGTKYAIVLR